MGQKTIRKIVKVGSNSYGIVLPIGWIRYNGLDFGDRLSIETNSDIKILLPGRRKNDFKTI